MSHKQYQARRPRCLSVQSWTQTLKIDLEMTPEMAPSTVPKMASEPTPKTALEQALEIAPETATDDKCHVLTMILRDTTKMCKTRTAMPCMELPRHTKP